MSRLKENLDLLAMLVLILTLGLGEAHRLYPTVRRDIRGGPNFHMKRLDTLQRLDRLHRLDRLQRLERLAHTIPFMR